MSPAAIRCVLHLSSNFIKAHFCAARACAGSLLNLSDYSLMRDELPLALEARAVCRAMRWMRSSYPSSPFKGSIALASRCAHGPRGGREGTPSQRGVW